MSSSLSSRWTAECLVMLRCSSMPRSLGIFPISARRTRRRPFKWRNPIRFSIGRSPMKLRFESIGYRSAGAFSIGAVSAWNGTKRSQMRCVRVAMAVTCQIEMVGLAAAAAIEKTTTTNKIPEMKRSESYKSSSKEHAAHSAERVSPSLLIIDSLYRSVVVASRRVFLLNARNPGAFQFGW